jgi:hypothetical protein
MRIRWPLRQKWIPAENIASIETMDSHPLDGAIRTFGAGGLWGGFGLFWSRKQGHFVLYASRQDGLVRIGLRRGKSLLITPVGPEQFAAAAKRILEISAPKKS